MFELKNRFIMSMIAILAMPLSALFCSIVQADTADANDNYQIGNVPSDIYQTMNEEGCQPIQDFHSPEHRSGSPFVRIGKKEYVALCQFEVQENIFKYKIVINVENDHPFSSCSKTINLARLEYPYRINWDIDFTYKPTSIGLRIVRVPEPEYHKYINIDDQSEHLNERIQETLLGIAFSGACMYCHQSSIVCVSGDWYYNQSTYAD